MSFSEKLSDATLFRRFYMNLSTVFHPVFQTCIIDTCEDGPESKSVESVIKECDALYEISIMSKSGNRMATMYNGADGSNSSSSPSARTNPYEMPTFFSGSGTSNGSWYGGNDSGWYGGNDSVERGHALRHGELLVRQEFGVACIRSIVDGVKKIRLAGHVVIKAGLPQILLVIFFPIDHLLHPRLDMRGARDHL
jgi:hypothetical protein